MWKTLCDAFAQNTYLTLSMFNHHDSCNAELQKRLEALFAAMAGFIYATEGKFDAAAGTVTVDKSLARQDPPRDADRPRAIAGPAVEFNMKWKQGGAP